MSGALTALRVALTEAPPDTIYASFLAIRQTASREPDPATEALLLVVSALFAAAYSESEAVPA